MPVHEEDSPALEIPADTQQRSLDVDIDLERTILIVEVKIAAAGICLRGDIPHLEVVIQ